MLDRPKMDPALLARFTAIVGEKYAITDPDIQAPYLIEQRNMFQGHTPVVLRPANVAEVSAIANPDQFRRAVRTNRKCNKSRLLFRC